ncbi:MULTISPECIES: hypothetical protein, partial [Paraburkholderia]|uniref:hypothetical protein n=1 Tax=Paraburkholderia TaxID=1822464 RepID=UPI003218AD98
MGNFSVAGEGQANESGLTCIIRFSLPKRDRCGASLPEARAASRLLKYSPTEAAFLHLRGSRHKVYRIVQFQREFHAC